MKSRREIVQLGLASLALTILGSSEAHGEAGIKTIYQRDLPPVSLDGWQVTVLQLIFRRGLLRPSTFTQASFSVMCSRENSVFTSKVLPAGEVFYEAPGAVHLPSGSASATKQARVLALVFSEKGKKLMKLL